MQNATAIEFINGLAENAAGILMCRNDLEMLVGLAFAHQQVELLHSISFTAKYINGLKRVLATAAGNQEIQNTAQIQSDLTAQVQKVLEQLRELAGFAEASFRGSFEKQYLQMNATSFAQLTNLLQDFEQVKIYFNMLRRAQD